MLDGSLPIRVLVDDGRQDLVQVIAVRISDVRAQDARPSIRLDAVLHVLRVEGEVRFGTRHAGEQVVSVYMFGHIVFFLSCVSCVCL